MPQALSPSDYQKLIGKASGKARSKYGAKKTSIGSITFDSGLEAKHYSALFIMQQRGEISDLELQPIYPIIINGSHVCKVILDFRYRDKDGRIHVVDAKGKDTAISRLKRKLVEAAYPGMKVEIVKTAGRKAAGRRSKQ